MHARTDAGGGFAHIFRTDCKGHNRILQVRPARPLYTCAKEGHVPVKPIPEGYHSLTPSLVVDNAAGAIEWYKKALGAEEMYRMPGPDGKTIVHAEIRIGDSILMLSDEYPQSGIKSPKALGATTSGLMLYVDDVDAAFNRAVAAGATVRHPVSDMFWGDRMGNLTDPFGHSWSIATHKEDLTPAQIEERGREFLKKMAGG